MTAPSRAASRSASANTRNGALPPSSMDSRRSCSDAPAIRPLPTAVEPVKDSLRVRGSASRGAIASADRVVVTTLSTPGGRPASARISVIANDDSGVKRRRLEHHGATGRQRRADLAGGHRHREVPGRDQHTRPDRLAGHEDPALTIGRHRVPTVDANRLLGEPAEEVGGVGDLGLGVGDGLAHLQGHEQGQLVDAVHEGLERPPEDLAPPPGGGGRPSGLSGGGGIEGGDGVAGVGVGDLGQHRARRRVLDLEAPPGRSGPPLPVDEDLTGDHPEDLVLIAAGHPCAPLRGRTLPIELTAGLR